MIVFILLTLFLIISLFITKIIKGTLLCVNTIFNFTWCIFLGISSLGLYGLYKPSTTVYIYSIIVIVVFNLVSYGFGFIGREATIMKNDINITYNYKLLYVLNYSAYFFSINYLIKSITILRQYGFFMMRYYTTGAGGYAETSSLLIYQWIILPIFIITIIVNAISMAKGNKNWKLLAITILDIGLYVLLFGGRYIIVRFMFITMFAYLWFERGMIIKFLMKHKRIVSLIGVLLIIVIYLTSKRSISNLSFMGNLITYFSGSFVFLSELLKTDIVAEPLLGRAVFGGVYNFLYAILKIIFGVEYLGSDVLITSITSQYIRIGEDILYNSLSTMIYPFIRDFGMFGLVIDTIIFSSICNFIERKAFRSMKMSWSIIYLYITFIVFDSILQYDLLGPMNSVLIILVNLLSYKMRIKIKL